MPLIPALLAAAAEELREQAASAPYLGLEPDELRALADRLDHVAGFAPEQVIAALRPLAEALGDGREAWDDVVPAFVALMDAVLAG